MASGVAVASVIATAGFSAFPFLLPSSLDLNASLTVWDASSSRSTFLIMFFATLAVLPLVLLGVGFAVSFPIINAMWLEQKEEAGGERAGAAGADGLAGRC